MRITLLGPLSVEIGGDAVSLGGQKQQALLSFLVLNSSIEMSADRCIDAVWGDQATPGSVHSLQTYVSNLRRLLEPHHEKGEPWTVIESTPTGYRFAGHSQASDLRHFEELVDQAADAPPEQAVEFLADALELWGERPLGDLGDEPWAHAFTARLTEMHLDALAGFFDARLELGEHDAVVGDVEALVGSHPYDGRLWGQLMLALYR